MVCVFPGWGGCTVGRLRLVCAFGSFTWWFDVGG